MNPTNDLPIPTSTARPALSTDPLSPALGSTGQLYRAVANPYVSRATTILVLGIFGLVLFPPVGIAAWIMGSQLSKEANAVGYAEPGRSRGGRICGIIATTITIAIVIGMMLFMVNRTDSHMNRS
jgi:hypothetical protein